MRLFCIFLFFFTLNCSTNKVSKNHGYSSLETKFNKIIINKTNKNDVINNIGPPSSISDFDNNKWFYIERKKTNQSLLKLGLKKIDKNNIIEVNFNNMGIVNNKKLLNLNDMNDVNYVKNITEKNYQKGNFMYGVLSSFREKINAPARKRSKK